MKKSFLIIVGIIVVVLAVLIWSALYIVQPRQIAVVQRFGEIVDVRTEPGLYFKLPFGSFQMDNKYMLTSQMRRLDLKTSQLQVRDGRYYSVDAFLIYRINDARRFVAQSGTSLAARNPYDGVERKLSDIFYSSLRAVYGTRSFEDALSEERNNMMKDVRNQILPQAQGLGLEIVDVRIQRTDLPSQVSEETYKRMKQERLTEAERLTAQGRIESQTIEADADRQYTEIIAKATMQADILRGQGEAESTRLFAKSAAKNPEFFTFWLSMNAYQNLDSTPMIISPNSEFFRYLRPASPKVKTPAETPR